jgi:hypothetical protein
VAVAAMSADDAVLFGKMHAHADRGRFLGGIEVDEAWDLPRREFDVQSFLEIADQAHRAISTYQVLMT